MNSQTREDTLQMFEEAKALMRQANTYKAVAFTLNQKFHKLREQSEQLSAAAKLIQAREILASKTPITAPKPFTRSEIAIKDLPLEIRSIILTES